MLSIVATMVMTSSAFAQVSSNSWSQSNSSSNSSGNSSTYVSTPGLTSAGNQSCAGSSSFGISMMGFGISGGSTTEMPGCEARSDALVLNQLGLRNAGALRMCTNKAAAIALAYDGKPCPPEYYTPQQRAMIFGPTNPVSAPRSASQTPVNLADTGRKRIYNADTNTWYYPN